MKFIFLLTLIFIIKVGNAFWSDCAGNIPGFDSFESPQCSNNRCRASRGDIFSGTFLFHTPGAYDELRIRATAFIFGIGVNLLLTPPHDNFCNFLQFPNGTATRCPTITNQQYFVEFVMEIPQIFPAMSNTRVQADFFNGNDRVLCIQVLAVDLFNAFWSACPGTNLPTLDSMAAIRCTNKCQVTRGEVFHATLTVTFKKTHQELKSKVTAFILFGIGINLPLDPSLENQCNTILFVNGTKADCPTIPNIQYILPIKMPIKMFYPTFTNTKVQGEYFDGNERILCFEVIADVL